ncbi:ATP-dependent nuclease [Pseudonocardia xinjiangensis]|uniref:ATP-dependent nuclease n=1 Tax=Pseudonocardia xinjiangensis TaxID=75289 RepID=UPI003D91872B
MRLASIGASNFRAFDEVTIPLRNQVTVVIGENNAGKSTLLDMLRLVTDPLDGRRNLYWDADDIARAATADRTRLVADYELTSPDQRHFYVQALLPGTNQVRYAATFTPPPVLGLRGRLTWVAGNGATTDRDPEPAARDRLRHVYLPPLRDAQRELNSSSGARLRTIFRYLLAETGAAEAALVEHVHTKFDEILDGHPIFQAASRAVRAPLADITAGARMQDSDLSFADPDLLSIARSLQMRMNDHGLDPRDIAESGLGYANLLFIATVLVELRASRQQDLTLFLVEEPEAHLHPQLQILLLEYLHDAAQMSHEAQPPGGYAARIQVVVTTHSPLITASTHIDDVVVLKRAAHRHSPRASTATAAPTSASAPVEAPTTVTPFTPIRFTSRPIPLASLGLAGLATAKLQRYLDATRSAMFFAPRILLVEGIAEALLLPVFARRVLNPPSPAQLFPSLDEEESEQAEKIRRARAPWARYQGTTLVPIDSVDFEPYVQVLLTRHAGVCLADRVAVITDADPSSPGDRSARLKALAVTLGADTHSFEVFTAQPTLEPELLRAATRNQAAVKAAYLNQRPRAGADHWAEIESKLTPEEQIAEFSRHFVLHGLRKGQFAQDLAAQVAGDPTFVVPGYLERAIRWVSEAERAGDPTDEAARPDVQGRAGQ